jgi:two-component system CheB/CheR fusion protein
MAKARTGNPSVTPDEPAEPAEGALTRVVGIGASAGGLEALQEFLAPLKPDGTAFVIAQHLAPDHPSLIVELLSRCTPVQVLEAIDGEPLRPGTVVIGPPNRDLTIEGDRVRLVEPAERLGPSPNIDLLFESLAAEWGQQSVAVVLSGTGSDGSRGLRSIRSAGGLTLVQSPQSARFDGMPRAAIALGSVDLVADATALGEQLAGLTPESGALGEGLPLADHEALPTITARLKRATGIDFSGYKESTLSRQVQRRMAIRQMSTINAYLAVLLDDAEEAHALTNNLLVTVTSFFRDPGAFDTLREELATYLARPDTPDVLRVWVPGCATGEEVYSIAMLVSEALGRPTDLLRHLKIFGTDLDDASLMVARRAVYPLSAVAHIPATLREAYTKEAAEGFQIADVIRECTVFARHDVGADPPFPRIDLVSCRNTLIYFQTPLQDRVLAVFGFALRPGGLLFLGSAENLDPKSSGFRIVDADHRIFTRTGQAFPPFTQGPTGPPDRVAPIDRRGIRSARAPLAMTSALEQQVGLLEAVLRQAGKAFLALDDEHRLIEVVGDVGPYCRVAEGRMTGAVVSFLRPELQDEARALLLLCRADPQPVVGRSVRLDGLDRAVHMVAARIQLEEATFTVLVFEPDATDAAAPPSVDRGTGFDREVRRLEHELLVSQDTLRRSMAELQAVNEELEASSEELQAASEELQASNEELQASNEELLATNEELGTLNQELTLRGHDLEGLNIDLENIQSSLSQGMVIVDRDLKVTRFTPIAVRVFALMDADIGRLLLSVPTTVPIPGLAAALRSVAAGAPRMSIEAGDDHVTYLVQVLPYQAPDGRRLGAIVTLTDVSEMVDLRTIAEHAFNELKDKSQLLEHESTFDAVTGLVNRGHFSQVLESAIARAQRSRSHVALAWIDLDKFKEINDEYGHQAGDVTLQMTGQRVTQSVRGSDPVGRLGGDEIGVLITGYDTTAELDLVLERIVASTREPITVEGQEMRVTSSVGVALFPDDAQSSKDLMRAADAAMYSVKRQSGDGYAYFDESMNEAAGARRVRRREIAAAISNSEFVMHYQPVVHATSGAVWGVEALVRWNKDGAVLPAGEFVPFCQDSGQIRALGLVTIDLVRADVDSLRAAGHTDLHVAFNMSATQLEDRHVAELLEQVPGPNGLDGLVVEILESVFLPDHGQALQVLQQLSALGAETSIDDYGAGYSNVRLLETLEPDYIKLDRSFLSEHHNSESRAALVRSAVEICHVVGALCIAEGIETDEQHGLVREAGVDFVQGFGVALPMPLDELLAWLRDRATG